MNDLELMTKKLEKFPTLVPVNCDTWTSYWKSRTWDVITKRYADTLQRDLLRALTIAGYHQSLWDTVFQRLYAGADQWRRVNCGWFEHRTVPGWQEILDLVVNELDYQVTFYPAFEPQWLVGYGYSQSQYIADLKEYWDDISPVYFQPWPSSRIGYDIVAYEAIQQISQETQADIEQLIQSAGMVLRLAKNGDSYDNQ